MDSSAISAFSDVDVQDDGLVVVKAAGSSNNDAGKNDGVEFPDVFSHQAAHVSTSQMRPRPLTQRIGDMTTSKSATVEHRSQQLSDEDETMRENPPVTQAEETEETISDDDQDRATSETTRKDENPPVTQAEETEETMSDDDQDRATNETTRKDENPPVTQAEETEETISDDDQDRATSETTREDAAQEGMTPSSTSSKIPSKAKTLVSSLREGVQPGVSKRADFTLVPSKVALLVIDVQEYLSFPRSTEDEERNAYFYQTAVPRVVSNLSRLLEQLRPQRDGMEQGCEVIFTYLEALTGDCRDVSLDYKLSGPKLAELPTAHYCPATFLPSVAPEPRGGKGDLLIPKTSCSVFLSTNLHYVLQNLHVEQLLVCGQLTDQCVESAVRDAADLGYFLTVVEDACAAQSEASHAKGLMGMKGFSRILSTAQVLEELQHPSTEYVTRAVPRAVPAVEPEPFSTLHQIDGTIDTVAKSHIAIMSVVHYGAQSSGKTQHERAASLALLRALQFAGVQFVRITAVDAYNSIRCKAVPLDSLLKNSDLDHQVAIAEVCFAGLPTYGDSVVPGTGLDARRLLTVHPHLGTMRVLPYAPKTAAVLGTAHEGGPDTPLSPLCTRGLLARVVMTAKETYSVAFNVGAEIEFCLVQTTSNTPVDQSVFGNATTLNQQESFLAELYTQLQQQHIDVSQIHAESAPGQLEVVLQYQDDPVRLADHVVLARETIVAVAMHHRLRAVFLPKVYATQAGNGCHLHLSFRRTDHATSRSSSKKDSMNAFPHAHLASEMSAEGKSFLEGILQHLPALLAVSMPTENSFRRVGPGCWTGSRVGWAVEDKESPLRVCVDMNRSTTDPRTVLSNVEYKLCDSTANIYLCLACILACGLNGIVVRESLRRPMSSSSLSSAGSTDSGDGAALLPSTLQESLACLEKDAFLMDLLGPTLGRAYVAVRQAEVSRAVKLSLSLEEEVRQAVEKC